MQPLLCKLENRRPEPDPASPDSDDPDQDQYDLIDVGIVLRWYHHRPIFEIIGQIAQGYNKGDKPFVHQIDHNDLGLDDSDCHMLLLAAYHTLGGRALSRIDDASTPTLDFETWINSRMYHSQASRLCRQIERSWSKYLSRASGPVTASP